MIDICSTTTRKKSNMSNEAFTREEITLQDGTDVELRPLTVGKKRKFMRSWTEHVAVINDEIKKATEAAGDEPEAFDIDEANLSDKQYDAYIKLCGMCLEGELKKDKTTKQWTEYLEDTLDDPTIFKIIKVCGGIDLEAENTPN
jgi:hypothetical protein